MSAAVLVGVLVAGGLYLVLQRGLVRVTFGFVLLGHAVNVLLLAAGGLERRGAPLVADETDAEAAANLADPLPQAFVLTAIVITFGITVLLLTLARQSGDAGLEPAGPDRGPTGGEVPR